jgi:hypothetical protein
MKVSQVSLHESDRLLGEIFFMNSFCTSSAEQRIEYAFLCNASGQFARDNLGLTSVLAKLWRGKIVLKYVLGDGAFRWFDPR